MNDEERRILEYLQAQGAKQPPSAVVERVRGAMEELCAAAAAVPAARFAERLRKYLGLPVELADERLSSWEAAQQVQVTGGRAARRAGQPLDDVAAAIILRDYLSRGRRAEQARTGRAEQTRAASAEQN